MFLKKYRISSAGKTLSEYAVVGLEIKYSASLKVVAVTPSALNAGARNTTTKAWFLYSAAFHDKCMYSNVVFTEIPATAGGTDRLGLSTGSSGGDI